MIMKPIKSLYSKYNQNDIYMLERIGPYSIINDNHQGLIVLVQIYLRNRIKSISPFYYIMIGKRSCVWKSMLLPLMNYMRM